MNLFSRYLLAAGICAGLSVPLRAQVVETLVNCANNGNTANDQFVSDLAVDGAGRRFVCGQFTGNGNSFGAGLVTNINSAGANDAHLAAYDPTDALLWVVQIGGTGADFAAGVCVVPDANNRPGVYVTGAFTGTNVTIQLIDATGTQNLGALASGGAADENYFLLKFDENGQLMWAYTSNGAPADREQGQNVAAVRVGNQVIVSTSGRYTNQTNFDDVGSFTAFTTPIGGAGDWDGFVLSYTDNGANATINWGNTVRGNNPAVLLAQRHDQVLGTTCDDKGDVLVTGQITSGCQLSSLGNPNFLALAPNGTDDIFVARYTVGGNLVWGINMGGAAVTANTQTAAMDLGRSIAVDRNGLIYVTGIYSTNTATAVNLAGSNLFGYRAGAVAGTAFNDIFVVQLTDGTLPPTAVWAQRIGSTTRDYPTNICVDNCGVRLYLSGDFTSGPLNFPSGATLAITPGGSIRDGFFTELDVATGGTDLTRTRAGGTGGTSQIHSAASINVNAVGDVSVCGFFCCNNFTVGALAIPNSNPSVFPTVATWDGFFARWDNINYPVTTASTMTHGGIAASGCNVYTSGSLTGAATVAGTPITSNSGSSDVYIMGSDLYGNPNMFTQLTNDPVNTSVTDSDVEPVQGNLVVAGFSNTGLGTVFVGSPVNSTATTRVGYVCEVNTAGTVLWNVFAESTGPAPGPANIWAVSTNFNGDVFVCGNFTGTLQFRTPGFTPGSVITVPTGLNSAGGEDYFIAKFDFQGHLVWCTSGGGTLNDNATDLKVIGGDIYMTGLFRNIATFNGSLGSSGTLTAGSGCDGFVLYFVDVAGTTPPVLMSRAAFAQLSGDDVGTGIDAVSPSDVVISSVNNITTGFVRSFNMTTIIGTQTWMQTIAGSFLNGIAIANNRVFVCTWFAGALTMFTFALNSSPLCNVAMPSYVTDMFVLQGNTYGDDGENIFACGNFPTGNPSIISRVSSHGCGISSRIGQIGSEEEETTAGISTVKVFPNPFHGSATLEIESEDLEELPASLAIFDMSGRMVYSQANITTRQTTIMPGELSHGFYLYRVMQNGIEIGSGKVIIAD